MQLQTIHRRYPIIDWLLKALTGTCSSSTLEIYTGRPLLSVYKKQKVGFFFALHFSHCRSHFRLRREGGVKCHMKVLSFVRDVRTFEMTPKRYFQIFAVSHWLKQFSFRPVCWINEHCDPFLFLILKDHVQSFPLSEKAAKFQWENFTHFVASLLKDCLEDSPILISHQVSPSNLAGSPAKSFIVWSSGKWLRVTSASSSRSWSRSPSLVAECCWRVGEALRHHYRARNWTFDENHFLVSS